MLFHYKAPFVKREEGPYIFVIQKVVHGTIQMPTKNLYF